jgi:acetyl esterase/lipase
MMHRRDVLLLAAGVLTASAAHAAEPDAPPSETVPLWPAEPPGGGGPSGPVAVDHRGAISNIARPDMQVFVPAQPNGAAMLVAAGGGYRRIGLAHEAFPAAQWLTARGITAFVLEYRLPDEGWNVGPLAPLQDAQRALRLIRDQAEARKLDPARLGVLGFSAGGNLLGLAATRSGFASYTPVDDADVLSARPDNAALIYPVITVEPPYDHTSTRRVLVGEEPTTAESREWSVQSHVGPDCPPTFLVQAADDRIANPANIRIMAAACEKAGISVEMHEVPTGGHGFGMGRPGTPTMQWPDWYAGWLARIGVPG